MSVLTMGVRFLGLSELMKSLDGAAGRLDDELFKRMSVLVLEVAGSAQRYIVGSRATNPPELLGVRTGRLRQSITGRAKRVGPGRIEGVISPQRVVYAATHELGDPRRNIPARPYLARGLDAMKDRIVEQLGGAFSASVLLQ